MANIDLKEKRKQWLHLVTAFSPRDSLSELGFPLGLPKEFSDMEQKLQEMHTKEDDSLFYYHSSEDLNPRIIAAPSLEGL